MKRLLFIFLVLPITIFPVCKRDKYTHVNTHVRHCDYTQDDIYRAYTNKPNQYGFCERHKKCVLCHCPLSEHTKIESKNIRK